MPWSDAPGLCAHALVVRSVGQEGGSPQWGVVYYEHTRRPTPVFMNTKKVNSNFHRPTWACGGRPPAPKQHTPTPVGWAFDGRPLQHCESRFWASSNPKFPFVHEQTTPAASSRTGHPPQQVRRGKTSFSGHVPECMYSNTREKGGPKIVSDRKPQPGEEPGVTTNHKPRTQPTRRIPSPQCGRP